MAGWKVITPKPLNTAAMKAAMQREAQTLARFIRKDFERVTAGWSGARPEWMSIVTMDGFSVTVEITVRDPGSEGARKWVYLDEGTRPHPIRPKKAGGVLAFPSTHQAGSRPGSLRTFRGSSGGPTVFTPEVQHPGTEARGWTVMLKEQEEPTVREWLRNACNHAARASGHKL